MTAPLDAGSLSIEVRTADGAVVSTHIGSTRPMRLSRALIGTTAAEAPALVVRLFGLCGVAHSIACAHAAAAAGATPEKDQASVDAMRLLSERLAESMRGALLSDAAAPIAQADARVLRQALTCARNIATLDGPAAGAGDIRSLAAALGELGLPSSPGDQPIGRLGGLLAEAEENDWFASGAPDALTSADDAAVVAMAKVDDDFAASPALPGRTVETGAYARRARTSGAERGGLAARLRARIEDMVACRDELLSLAEDGAPPALVNSATTGANEGFAALESPRGRLYHWLRAADDGKIAAYAIVAPTEWNFHADGPFVRMLAGARVGAGETARRRIERLAASFDPCVAFMVSVVEARDA